MEISPSEQIDNQAILDEKARLEIMERVQEMSPEELEEYMQKKQQKENVDEMVEALAGFEKVRDLIQVSGTTSYKLGQILRGVDGINKKRDILHKKAKERRAKRKRGGHK